MIGVSVLSPIHLKRVNICLLVPVRYKTLGNLPLIKWTLRQWPSSQVEVPSSQCLFWFPRLNSDSCNLSWRSPYNCNAIYRKTEPETNIDNNTNIHKLGNVYYNNVNFFVGNVDASNMDLLKDIVPIDEFWAETLLLEPYSTITTRGICIIIDVENFSWKCMKWVTPHNLRIMLKRVQSLPIKDFKFHVVNDSFLIHSAIRFLWVFLPQYIRDSVSIFKLNSLKRILLVEHWSGGNWKYFHYWNGYTFISIEIKEIPRIFVSFSLSVA